MKRYLPLLLLLVAAPCWAQGQFTGLITTAKTPSGPGSSATCSGNCSTISTPANSIPSVYAGTGSGYHDSSMNGSLVNVFRITPQPSMPNNGAECGYKPIYATTQAWNADGTLLMLTRFDSGSGCGGFINSAGIDIFCGKNDGSNSCHGLTCPTGSLSSMCSVGNPITAAHYQFVADLPNSIAQGDGYDEWDGWWDSVDPCILYYFYNLPSTAGDALRKINVCTMTLTTVATFTSATDTASHTITFSSSPFFYMTKRVYCNSSDAGTAIGFTLGDGSFNTNGFGVVTLTNGGTMGGATAASIAWFHKLTSPGDYVLTPAIGNKQPAWSCMSPDGDKVYASWNTPTTGYNHSGTEVFNATTGAFISYTNTAWTSAFAGNIYSQDNGLHMDAMRDVNANEGIGSAFCSPNGGDFPGGGGSSFVNYTDYLFDPTKTLNCPGITTGNNTGQLVNAVPNSDWGGSWHYSGRGSVLSTGLRGWGLISTFGGQTADSTGGPFQSEVFAIKNGDPTGSNSVVRIVHNFGATNDSSNGHQYFAEPHATVDRAFQKVLYGSTWNQCGSLSNLACGDNVDAYIGELPVNPTTQTVAPFLIQIGAEVGITLGEALFFPRD